MIEHPKMESIRILTDEEHQYMQSKSQRYGPSSLIIQDYLK